MSETAPHVTHVPATVTSKYPTDDVIVHAAVSINVQHANLFGHVGGGKTIALFFGCATFQEVEQGCPAQVLECGLRFRWRQNVGNCEISK